MKRQVLFFAWLLTATIASAQFPFQCEFNHLAIPVKDLDASVRFYQQVFRLEEITNRTKNPAIRWLSLGGGKELHLISTGAGPVAVNKSLHMALSTPAINELAEHLRKSGVSYSDWEGKKNTMSPRADGVMQLYLQDPDGYWIEVNNGYDAKPNDQQVKDAVWKLEEDYWVYVKQLDLEKYRTLWHDRFMGYPSTNIIGGKANITDWLTDMHAKNKGNQLSYKLDRKVENVFDDIVIVLYDATMTWTKPDGSISSQSTAKLTHTWMKTDKGWLIIGGMGAIK